MNRVVRVVATNQFEAALKKLKKDHKTKILEQLKDVVEKLIKLEITTQNQNHPLKNAKGHRDLHLDGKRLILLYKYDYASDNEDELLLFVTLKLQDIVDHKQLSRYDLGKFDSPVHEFDPSNILSGTDIIAHGKYIIY